MPKELRTIRVEEYMGLVNDLRHGSVIDDCSGPKKEDMITFLCGSHEICR